ncbi:ribose-5-phosphate isomerase RpiA [Amycolatopsis alkalitolerans]|uniref:Ribose-5-phosphate isomerase A n=1 Tax=Amycolatopsis alkalitolerans TaxID=2547244 RepID=A0A5C4LR77_9PSEU|nr:ribose-5-phosphate isomerase RpiA [Amycolatopsis alkalitolerans]TNC19397.1 ribose-5-phosphate isomerase RpiA [Amycolatopsis alkalitolerans]
MEPKTGLDRAKRAAGVKAAERYCTGGMKLGLGSGTTAHWFVRALAERVRDGLDVVGVPTSTATRDLALELGIPLADLDAFPELDLTVDGADEIDRHGDMIKGGGACLLWEKIVARASRRVVIVADDAKIVDRLGAFPLPIEVLPFGWLSCRGLIHDLLTSFGYDDLAIERRTRDGNPVITDSGNYILDVDLGGIGNPATLAMQFNQIPGVIENGLFVGIAHEVVVGNADNTADVLGLPLPQLVG